MTGDSGEHLSRVALACLVEPGHRELGALVRHRGASAALDLLLNSSSASRQLTDALAGRLAASAGGRTIQAAHRLAETALATTQRLDARVITPEDEEWPDQVAQMASTSRDDRDTYPPLCLWVRGAPQVAELLDRSVALVGTRAATSYGQYVAADLAYGLANRDWTIASGGGYGIDDAAHQATLAAGGRTVAILASGIDRPHPVGHTTLFEQIVDEGLLLTEWPPGAQASRTRLLARTRMIASATRGVVLMEAGLRTAARATLHHARLLHRPAMVVPGPVTSALSVGCHTELRDHPQNRLVRDSADVIAELTAPPHGPRSPARSRPTE